MNNKHIIMVLKVKDSDETILHGSSKDVCSECKEDVWVSRSSMQMRKENESILMCSDCLSESGKDYLLSLPSKEQIDEVKADIIYKNSN